MLSERNFLEELSVSSGNIKDAIKRDDSEEFTELYRKRTEYILENLEGLYSEEFEEIIKKENEVIKEMLDDKKKILAEQIMESKKENYRRKAFALYE